MNKLKQEKIVKFQDLLKINTVDNNEPFVLIEKNKIPFGYKYIFSEMKKTLGKDIYVRKGTWQKLLKAQNIFLII